MAVVAERSSGQAVPRVDGLTKTRGLARYAFEEPADAPVFLAPLHSTVARGRIRSFDTTAASEVDGVVAVLSHENCAGILNPDCDPELWVLQNDSVWFYGQFVGAVLAETSETALHAARLVDIEYDQEAHNVRIDEPWPRSYRPAKVNPAYPTETSSGDVPPPGDDDVHTDQTYITPFVFHQPMEPHTTAAIWRGNFPTGSLRLFDSTQGVSIAQQRLADAFGIDSVQIEVTAQHVGGGFGSKLYPHAHEVLTGLAAIQVKGRLVKFAMPRSSMFAGVGYRSKTVHRVRLSATRDGELKTIDHAAAAFTSRYKEFVEAAAVCTRSMYRAASVRTSHAAVPVDLSCPSVMRAPGVGPGMFALESAIDELCDALELDPVDVRLRNEPQVDPTSGLPYSTRNLAACLREGATAFDWVRRRDRSRDDAPGEWQTGIGVAAATYPMYNLPGTTARITYTKRRYLVELAAMDIGTGTRTALAQVAADALDVAMYKIDLRIGTSTLPFATQEGGSSGIASWGSAILEVAGVFRTKYGHHCTEGDTAEGQAQPNPAIGHYSMNAYGAQFAEVQVSNVTGEIRVSRMLGRFATGRIINPRTARSQIVGGMVMGLSMALHEDAYVDEERGMIANHELSSYHIASAADLPADIDVDWVDEIDYAFNPLGTKGVGEIGLVGVASAISNAVYDAVGVRIRELPLTPDKILTALPGQERRTVQ